MLSGWNALYRVKGFRQPLEAAPRLICWLEPQDLADEVMSVAGSLEPEFARVAEVRKVIDGAT